LKDDKTAPSWDKVEDSQEIMQLSATLELILGITSAIRLGVGGVGVMNIMPVSVTERMKEISLLKALGACRRDIMSQFLLQSLTTLTCWKGSALAVSLNQASSLIKPPPNDPKSKNVVAYNNP